MCKIHKIKIAEFKIYAYLFKMNHGISDLEMSNLKIMETLRTEVFVKVQKVIFNLEEKVSKVEKLNDAK